VVVEKQLKKWFVETNYKEMETYMENVGETNKEGERNKDREHQTFVYYPAEH